MYLLFSISSLLLTFALIHSGNAETSESESPLFIPNMMMNMIKDEEHLKELKNDAIDWAHYVGLKFRVQDHKDKSDLATIVPISLFPSPFPRKVYDQAVAVQEAMALLYFRASWNFEFMTNALAEVEKSDEVVQKMMGIYREAHVAGIKQPIAVLPIRNDYMMHINKSSKNASQFQLKQVEVNIGYMGGGSRGPGATKVHRRITSLIGFDQTRVPENHALETVCKGIYYAWKKLADPKAVLVMLINPISYGHFEPRAYEYELERVSKFEMPILLLSMEQANERLTLEDDSTLRLDDGRRVGIVFSRATALASSRKLPDFIWEVKRKVELSTAIKIPTLGEELASTKKVQQVLAVPGMVEKFFTKPEEKPMVEAIRRTFAGLWGLQNNNEEAKQIIAHAIAHPEKYVLKPQKEGGGRNLWNKEMVEKLENASESELAEYILQQRIESAITENYAIRPKDEEPEKNMLITEKGNVITELSTFGCLVGNGVDGTVFQNEGSKEGTEGYFMRTKWSHVTEGGVLKGEGVYDSPYLI